MIPRDAETTLHELAAGFPVVGIAGPRQSGKTTLARAVFADRPYASLEEPDIREFATEDPRGFLANYLRGPSWTRCSAARSYSHTSKVPWIEAVPGGNSS